MPGSIHDRTDKEGLWIFETGRNKSVKFLSLVQDKIYIYIDRDGERHRERDRMRKIDQRDRKREGER